MISAGNTGATMASALLRIGRIKGVNRPAIATPLPVPGHAPNILLDAGANAEVQPEWLVQFAQMGTVYARERYGMSETVMLTSNPCKAADGERVVGTVGQALPGVQLRVRDEAGRTLPAGQTGGIEVRGPNVFQGYWQMPEKTAQEFTPDGFFKTGDVGFVDAKGYVTIVGRSKDLIISGGYNVYPAEIEGYINNLPGVEESAVVGVPDADFGEVGLAVVVPKAGQSLVGPDIVAALKAQLANFKVPKRCIVVQALPRNAMGKVQKNVLRAEYTAGATH
jgi:malonyl-CoA/methylmalonyl-CoA synthetase